MNSMSFNVEHYHNTHSTQYRCTHYTLLSTARCFQSVCNSVTLWWVILFSTNSSPLVHPPVHFPPESHQSRHHPQGLSLEMRTVHASCCMAGPQFGTNRNSAWIEIFCVMTSCSLVGGYQCFGRTCSLHFQDQDEDVKFFLNDGK
jgi:hypothetical protein